MTVDNTVANDVAVEKRPAESPTEGSPTNVSSKKLKLDNVEGLPNAVVESPMAIKNLDAEVSTPTTETMASPATITEPSPIAPLREDPPMEAETEGRRPRRTATKSVTQEETVKPKKTRTKKTKVDDTEEEFNTAWICCECNEAECMMASDAHQLIICEGSCRRLFHYPCAGLPKPPEEADTFVCPDCQQGRHMCSFCQNYGDDNEDVFQCTAGKCGLYFHEACLEINRVEVQLIRIGEPGNEITPNASDDEDNDEIVADTKNFRREFECPAHHCWTCTQSDMVEKEKQLKAAESANAGKGKNGKRKKFKSSTGSLFVQKTKQLTIRCLVCPYSYHTSCIPPTARFNELSLLCPEHATTHRLPEVDPEISMQTTIEMKINSKFSTNDSPSRRRVKKLYRKNPFFYGKSGEALSQGETELMKDMPADTKYGAINQLPFCVPVNLRDEVHSKPPFYKHIHGNKYDPDNSPDRLQLPTEVCNCVDKCDEACMNRILYVECKGKPGTNGTNCGVGKDCGNRQLGQRKFKKCQPRREHGKGWGLVVLEDVKKKDLIIEYVGEIIDEKGKEDRLKVWTEEHPNDPNFYVMALGKGWYVDARSEANFARFINHSCDPNAIVHTINVGGYLRNGIFALRDIPAGTFLSYDYHFETMRGDRFVCRCGSAKCRGTMKDQVVEDDTEKTQREIWEAAQRSYDRDKSFLDDFHAKQAARRSQVDAMLPEAEFPSELIANGPLERHRAEAMRGRLFLWRNLRDNFGDRFARLEREPPQASPNITTTSRN